MAVRRVPEDYERIGEALKAVAPGDAVEVAPGTYREALVVDTPLELRGRGEAAAVRLLSAGPCLRIRADCTLESLSFAREGDEGGPAVLVERGKALFVDCSLHATSGVCVAVRGADAAATLRRVTVRDPGGGALEAADDATVTLEECEFSGCRDDTVVVRGATAVVLDSVLRDGAAAGLWVLAGGSARLEGCRLRGHAWESQVAGPGSTAALVECRVEDGIGFFEGAGGRIERSELFGREKPNVHVAQGADPLLRACRIHSGGHAGVYVADGGKGILEDCEVFGQRGAGVSSNRGSAPVLRRCRIHGNHDGVWAYDGGAGVVEECWIYGNADAGIKIEHDAALVVRRCRLSDQKYGVAYLGTAGGLLEGCELHGHEELDVAIVPGADPRLLGCRLHGLAGDPPLDRVLANYLLVKAAAEPRFAGVHGVRVALAAGASPNAVGREGLSALMLAARARSRDAVRDLLARGAAVHATCPHGRTALLYGAGDPEVVRRLLDAGAAADQRDVHGEGAVAFAVAGEGAEAVALLCAAGADANARDAAGNAPIFKTLRPGGLPALEALVAAGADLEVRSGAQEQTPLQHAARQGLEEHVRLLLAAGARVDPRDAEGHTARDLAVAAGHTAIAELLALAEAATASAQASNSAKSSGGMPREQATEARAQEEADARVEDAPAEGKARRNASKKTKASKKTGSR